MSDSTVSEVHGGGGGLMTRGTVLRSKTDNTDDEVKPLCLTWKKDSDLPRCSLVSEGIFLVLVQVFLHAGNLHKRLETVSRPRVPWVRTM